MIFSTLSFSDFLPLSTTIHGTSKYLKELDSLLQGQHFSGYFVSILYQLQSVLHEIKILEGKTALHGKLDTEFI